MTTTTLVFLIGALVVNVLTYGGITLAYFLDKRRVDPPRTGTAPATAPAPTATPTRRRPLVRQLSTGASQPAAR